MRVAIVLPTLAGGGAERLHLLLGEEFQKRGYNVDFVLLRAEGELLEEVASSARIIELGAPRFRHALVPLMRYLRRRRPAAILAAMWPLTGLAAVAKALSGIDCRLLASEHSALSHAHHHRGWSRSAHRHLGKWLYGLCDRVVCVSEGVRQDVITLTGLSRERTKVIYNPVRQANKGLADRKIMEWWGNRGGRLIAIGSLKKAKDYPTLLHAFSSLRQTKDARLLILGEGPLRSELEALCGTLGLGDSVLMPGFVADPYPYLAEADLLVLSSAWEGLGNVIIEALVCGTPVVSTDCPSGPREILDDGRYGRLVPVGDVDALAKAMANALAATHDREALKRRAADFKPEQAADAYLRLLFPDHLSKLN